MDDWKAACEEFKAEVLAMLNPPREVERRRYEELLRCGFSQASQCILDEGARRFRCEPTADAIVAKLMESWDRSYG